VAKIGQKYTALYMKTNVRFIVVGYTTSPIMRCL